MTGDLITTARLQEMAGINYARVDLYLRYRIIAAANTPGTGRPRYWPPEMVPVARLAARLSDAGMRIKAVRKVLESGQSRCEIAPGIWVEVESRG